MGVPKFYRWISERYPLLSEVIQERQIPEFDNLYFDMNGIIHACSHPNDDDPTFRITEEQIFKDIFHYIEVLFRIIKPRKVFFMAVDGVAPRAKMNQQRGRRFRSAKDAAEAEKAFRASGKELPKEERFDSNCITPGTKFMADLQEHLKYFVNMKITTDEMWQGITVVLSGHETPGEGEHKIMDYIRYSRSQPGYDPNTRHCLYGLDADLKELPFDYDLERIIDDWVLMGFLVGNDFIPNLPGLHINQDALPYLYECYIEVLPQLDGYLHEGGTLNLSRFRKYMEQVAMVYDDLLYLSTKTGKSPKTEEDLGLKEFVTFDDFEGDGCEAGASFREEAIEGGSEDAEGDEDEDDSKFLSVELREKLKMDEEALAAELDESGLCDEPEWDSKQRPDDWNDLLEMAFCQHKGAYYREKMKKEGTRDVIKQEGLEYVTAIQWILHYYYNGVCSWSWYYPEHYAPYATDVIQFPSDVTFIHFDKGVPFLPFQQLLAVLPSLSRKLLPEAYQDLMVSPYSSIIEYYPEDFKTDLNGKQQEWEAVVLIPFINEEKLLAAMRTREGQLKPSEKARNIHSSHLCYTTSRKSLGTYKSSLPSVFPDVTANRALCERVHQFEYQIPPENLVKSLIPGVLLDVYFPGFPTMRHLKFTAELKYDGVCVFQRNSKGPNMVIKLTDTASDLDLKTFALQTLKKQVLIRWPYVCPAIVEYVCTGEEKIDNAVSLECKPHEDEGRKQWFKDRKEVVDKYKHNKGVEMGNVELMAYAKPMVGSRLALSSKGAVEEQYLFANNLVPFPAQLIVKDYTSYQPRKQKEELKTLQDLFPVGSRVFNLGRPWYGSEGIILDNELDNGKMEVELVELPEPYIDYCIQNQERIALYFYKDSDIAGYLNTSTRYVSRITGMVFMKETKSSSKKVPIGLNLRSSAKNTEVADFSRRNEDDGTWEFSKPVVQSLIEYVEHFPEVVDHMHRSYNGQDVYIAEEVFGDNWKEKLEELQQWLKTLASYNAEKQPTFTKSIDSRMIKAIEKQVTRVGNRDIKKQTIETFPRFLYRPCLNKGNAPPDPKADFELFDRVVNVREGFTVPVGLRGTVIGIHPGENESDHSVDVAFDREFVGGMKIRTERGTCYRLPSSALINLSFGRVGKKEKQQGHPSARERESGRANNSSGQMGFVRGHQQPPMHHSLVGSPPKVIANQPKHSYGPDPVPRGPKVIKPRPVVASPTSAFAPPLPPGSTPGYGMYDPLTLLQQSMFPPQHPVPPVPLPGPSAPKLPFWPPGPPPIPHHAQQMPPWSGSSQNKPVDHGGFNDFLSTLQRASAQNQQESLSGQDLNSNEETLRSMLNIGGRQPAGTEIDECSSHHRHSGRRQRNSVHANQETLLKVTAVQGMSPPKYQVKQSFDGSMVSNVTVSQIRFKGLPSPDENAAKESAALVALRNLVSHDEYQNLKSSLNRGGRTVNKPEDEAQPISVGDPAQNRQGFSQFIGDGPLKEVFGVDPRAQASQQQRSNSAQYLRHKSKGVGSSSNQAWTPSNSDKVFWNSNYSNHSGPPVLQNGVGDQSQASDSIPSQSMQHQSPPTGRGFVPMQVTKQQHGQKLESYTHRTHRTSESSATSPKSRTESNRSVPGDGKAQNNSSQSNCTDYPQRPDAGSMGGSDGHLGQPIDYYGPMESNQQTKKTERQNDRTNKKKRLAIKL